MALKNKLTPSEGTQDQPVQKTVRAAIYARYSSQMQKADSIEDQVSIIRDYITSKRAHSRKWPNAKIEIVPEWILADEAKSGKSAARENYTRILDGIQADAFDLLLVDSLSRATRDLGGMLDLYDEIKLHGKELIAVSEGISTEDPSARIMFVAKGMVNDFENDARASATLRGMIGKYVNGFAVGDVPYGYYTTATSTNLGKGQNKACNYKVEIDERKAAVIRRMFQMYASGIGLASICKQLNQDGVEWPSFPEGKGWSQTTVGKFLGNTKYIGEWVWSTGKYFINRKTGQKVWKDRPKEEWIYFRKQKINEDLIIIDRELWDRVQGLKRELDQVRIDTPTDQKRRIRFVRNSSTPSTHLLSGLLECKVCGANMLIISGRRKGYYGCFAAHRKATCTNRSLIRARDIEAKVVADLQALLQSDDYAKKIADSYNRQKHAMFGNTENREAQLTQELQTLRVEVNNLVTFIASGRKFETVEKVLTAKEERIREVEHLLAYAVGSKTRKLYVTPGAIKEKLTRLLELFNTDRQSAKRIIRGLIKDRIPLETRADIENITITLNDLTIARDLLATA